MPRRPADDEVEPGQARPLPSIKVVGVSAAGKSTLVAALRALGYDAYAVSQEHSNVADLWKQFGIPRVLIALETDLATQRQRRPDVTWDAAHLVSERQRLSAAHQAADLRINTTDLTAQQVLALVVAYLERKRIDRAATALPPAPRTGGY